MKKLIWVFIILGLLILIWININSSKVSPISQIIPISSISPTPVAVFAKVTKVIDGDTIIIDTGQKIRYIGIDTTEIYPKVECYANEAKLENEKLVLGKTIKLEKDVSETDKYGRLLRYVYIDNIFINDDLVKTGFAKIETVAPDVKYKNEFLESENYAKQNNLGLWSFCKSGK